MGLKPITALAINLNGSVLSSPDATVPLYHIAPPLLAEFRKSALPK